MTRISDSLNADEHSDSVDPSTSYSPRKRLKNIRNKKRHQRHPSTLDPTQMLLLVLLNQVLCATIPLAPLFSSEHSIKDKFIVVLKETAPVDTHIVWFTSISSASSSINDIFPSINAYSASLNSVSLLALRQSDDVMYIEQDQLVWTSELEANAPWGLSRVAHREHPNVTELHHYSYQDDAGEGVTVYVVDTGVNIHHSEFEGRATWGATIPDGDEDKDGNGHGTHCAGTVAYDSFNLVAKPTALLKRQRSLL